MQKQPSEGFYKKGVVRNFAKFTRKHLCRSLFFDKVRRYRSATSLEERLQAFSCEFCEIYKNTFFAEHHRTTASDYSSINSSDGGIHHSRLNTSIFLGGQVGPLTYYLMIEKMAEGHLAVLSAVYFQNKIFSIVDFNTLQYIMIHFICYFLYFQ